MTNEVAFRFQNIDTVYRSRRGDYIGLKCELLPPPGAATSPRLVFLKTNNPENSAGNSLDYEASVHRALDGAPGVVPLLGTFITQERYYIMTEYSPHGDLESLINRHGPLGERDARLVVWQLLQGLQAIHRRGYAHMDVKPSNWIIKENLQSGLVGEIIDFGFALPFHLLAGNSSYKGRGTARFTAPEISNGLTIALPDRMDIYSAGCFLFYTLTGKFAYEPTSATHIRLHNFHEINWVCSAQALNFLCLLLHQDPMVRPTPTQALMHPWFALLLEEHDTLALSYPPAPRPTMPVANPPPTAPPTIVAAGRINAVPETLPTEAEEDSDTSSEPSNEAAVAKNLNTDDEDYVDEPTLPTQDGERKRRRKVGPRREIYRNQCRYRMLRAKMLRMRRQK